MKKIDKENPKNTEREKSIDKSLDKIVDQSIEKFEDIFEEGSSALDLEASMEKLIDREIKKRIARTTRSVLLKTAILVVGLVFVINPLVKAFYPDFYGMYTSEAKNEPIWDRLKHRYLDSLDYKMVDNYNSQYSDLNNLVYSFYATSDPKKLVNNVYVVDKQFGHYKFYIDTANTYDFLNSAGDIDEEIDYKRGHRSIDYSKPASVISADLYGAFRDKATIISEIKKLPESSCVFASVASKDLVSIADLLKDFDKNWDALPFWIRVVDPASHKMMLDTKPGQNIDIKDGQPKNHYIELGINSQAYYQLNRKRLKDKETGLYYTNGNPDYLFDDIGKLDRDQLRKKLKKVYMSNLDLIDKNRDIFLAFKDLHTTGPGDSENSFSFGTVYDWTQEKSKDEKGRPIPDQFDIYKSDIAKEDDLKTNLFTIGLTRDEFLKLLDQEWVKSANIINCKFSSFPSR